MAHVKGDRVRRSWHCWALAPCLIPPGPLAQSPFERSERTCGEEWASMVAFPRVPSHSWIGCSCPELYNCNLNSCNWVRLLWKRRRIGHRHPSSDLPWFSEDLWVFPRIGVLKIIPMCVDFRPRFYFLPFPILMSLITLFFFFNYATGLLRKLYFCLFLYPGNSVLIFLVCFVLISEFSPSPIHSVSGVL